MRQGIVVFSAILFLFACEPGSDEATSTAPPCYTGGRTAESVGLITDNGCQALITAAGPTWRYSGSMLGSYGAFFTAKDSVTGQWANISFDWGYCQVKTSNFSVGAYQITGASEIPAQDEYCQDFFNYRLYDTPTADDTFLAGAGGTLYLLREIDTIGACTLTVSDRAPGTVSGSVECSNLPRLFAFAGEAFGSRIDNISIDFSFAGISDDPLSATP